MNDDGSTATAIIIVGIAIGFACGLISASIASRKGLSTGGYFLLGFFLGVIGLIIAAVVTPRPGYGTAQPWPQAFPSQ